MNDNSFVTYVALMAIVMADEVLDDICKGAGEYKREARFMASQQVSKWSMEFCCSPLAKKPDNNLNYPTTYARLRAKELYGLPYNGAIKMSSDEFLKS